MFISTTEGDLSFHRQFKMTAPAPMTHSLIVGRSYGNSQVTMEGKHCKRSMANKKLSYRNPLRLFQQTRYLHIEGTKSAKTCEWCTVRLGRLQLSDWVIIYWQNIGNEDCSCCTCCIITYSKVSVTSWSHEEFLTLLQLIAWFIQSYDCTVVMLGWIARKFHDIVIKIKYVVYLRNGN
ncbi:uncharacterized protein LOC116920431 isoform X3 [Daphnia magna]|uniref:uncharacterized protein LOC116920431 isoform X3 n=1 Tax=Daphnia magna TaxID=35525 RepID=UPI001E1BD0A3|nr:uncharacterized protein LOC116920431 isoform X3 [Daphnia magna]